MNSSFPVRNPGTMTAAFTLGRDGSAPPLWDGVAAMHLSLCFDHAVDLKMHVVPITSLWSRVSLVMGMLDVGRCVLTKNAFVVHVINVDSKRSCPNK